MRIKNPSFPMIFATSFLFSLYIISSDVTLPPEGVGGGRWDLLRASIGVSAMHVQLLHTNKLVIFDRTDSGPSNLSLSAHCSALDCTAHSLLYDIASNTYRPLTLHSSTWCSSGSLDANGSLVQTGGYGSGEKVVRTFTPCDPDERVTCDWIEFPKYLSSRRWYASNQILPDGRIIIVGGRRAFTYEFYPRNTDPFTGNNRLFNLKFLLKTRDKGEENNLYPFLHLLPDGNLFIFANRRSISYDYIHHRVVREFPDIPGEARRNYPSTASSILLPLRLNSWNSTDSPEAEVMVCGGAPPGAFVKAEKGSPKVFVEASRTCGRMKVTDPNPKWVMETMPIPRVMPDMIILPTGDILIINGAANGTAGWENAANAVLNPFLYSPDADPPRRLEILTPSKIPRMYHSTAVLLPDGRILVGGSNPHIRYNFTATPYPTELSLEAYSPWYLEVQHRRVRPVVVTVEVAGPVSYGGGFSVIFVVPMVFGMVHGASVRLVAPAFGTHSMAMNQRMVVLRVARLEQPSLFAYKATVEGPRRASVVPPGYYMLFVVYAGVPSEGVWVRVGL